MSWRAHVEAMATLSASRTAIHVPMVSSPAVSSDSKQASDGGGPIGKRHL